MTPLSLWVVVLGCSEGPPPPSAQELADAAAVVQAQSAPPPPPLIEGEGLPVQFIWENIGSLHQGFFSDEAAVARLSRTLAPSLKSPPRVRVRYDELERVGTIQLVLAPSDLLSPITASEAGVDLLALRPLAMPMASYRDAIADRYDVRVRNFRVGIQLTGAGEVCSVGLAGELPHDGSVLSPCLTLGEYTASERRLCGEPAGALVRFPEHPGQVLACFR